MQGIRVVLADAHPVVREGLRRMFEQASEIAVVGDAGSGDEALLLAEELAPDVLLLEAELPGLSAAEVARRLQASGSPARLLVFSGSGDPACILAMLQRGVCGYLLKAEADEAVLAAVRGVARGEKGYLSPAVAEKVAAMLAPSGGRAGTLTARQLEVLRLVALGKSNGEIAHALRISEKTVEKHLTAAFAKLGVSSRLEAALRLRDGALVFVRPPDAGGQSPASG